MIGFTDFRQKWFIIDLVQFTINSVTTFINFKISDSAVNSIRKSSAASALKTDFGDQEEVAGNGKTIDYTLYNYGGSAVLSLTKDKTNALNFNDTQASTIAALGNAALILGGK